jgi:hypothetical protein
MKLRLGEWPFGNLDRLRELLRRVQMEETDFCSLKFPPFLGEIPNSAQHFYGLHPHFLFIRSPFREPKNTLKILVATQSLLVKSHLCCLFQSPQSIPSEFLSPFLIGALRDHSATGPLARCDQVTLPGRCENPRSVRLGRVADLEILRFPKLDLVRDGSDSASLKHEYLFWNRWQNRRGSIRKIGCNLELWSMFDPYHPIPAWKFSELCSKNSMRKRWSAKSKIFV